MWFVCVVSGLQEIVDFLKPFHEAMKRAEKDCTELSDFISILVELTQHCQQIQEDDSLITRALKETFHRDIQSRVKKMVILSLQTLVTFMN